MHLMDKQIGETPLQALHRLRKERGIPDEVPLSYAGRLDPMASGALLVLEGDECGDRERYLGLDKEYRVEALLGVSSDTGDILGITASAPTTHVNLNDARDVVASFLGPYTAPYPLFSSKTVQSKPLFQWALEGRTDEIEIPRQAGFIHDLTVDQLRGISVPELEEMVMSRLALLQIPLEPGMRPGDDFRISDVRESWQRLFAFGSETYQAATFTAHVGAGTYMRTFADDLAKRLGTRGLALSIHRTRIFIPKDTKAPA